MRPVRFEEIIKGSTFIASVAPVTGEDGARQWLAQLRREFADATHNCWAYVTGAVYRFSDDGEPGGTAGRPMLEVLQRRELDKVCAVVTRYYGGTKLGAGGLVRAYSGTLAKALDAADIMQVKPKKTLHIFVPFDEMDVLHRLLGDWEGLEKHEPEYDASGMIVPVTLLAEDVDALADTLREATRGRGHLQEKQRD
jgi:uncharacterized YigZ family protein